MLTWGQPNRREFTDGLCLLGQNGSELFGLGFWIDVQDERPHCGFGTSEEFQLVLRTLWGGNAEVEAEFFTILIRRAPDTTRQCMAFRIRTDHQLRSAFVAREHQVLSARNR